MGQPRARAAFCSKRLLASVLLDASNAGLGALYFGASAGPRARKSRSRPRDVRAGKFCPQFARKAIEFLRRSGRRQYRYLMDNLDPVEATEIFLVDAAAAANEPDHKDEIL